MIKVTRLNQTRISGPTAAIKLLMNSAIAIAGIGLLIAFGGAQAAAQDAPIRVIVDGSRVHFEDVYPQEIDGRILVPLRGVLEKVGAFVDWEPETQRVTCNEGELHIIMHIGERRARVNGRSVLMDVPAQTIAGHTMVPLRFLSESLGANVRWDSDENTVFVSTDGMVNRASDRTRALNGDRKYDH